MVMSAGSSGQAGAEIMEAGELFHRAARVLDALALPGALLWLVQRVPTSTSLTLWLATGVLGTWLWRRVLRAIRWDDAYRFSVLSIAAAGLAAFDFVWTANTLQRWLS